MLKYIFKRILQFIPVFIGVTFLMFAMRALVPGDPIKLIAGDKALNPEVELQIKIANHFIETDSSGKPLKNPDGSYVKTPFWKQYYYYMNNLFHGDFGNSYQRNMKVVDILKDKYPYTARLAVCAILLETIMGIGAGMVSAIKRYSFWDVLVTLVTSILVAIPAFWLGMLLQLTFGILLKNLTGGLFYLPISGAGGPFSDFDPWVYYILPSITLAAVSTAYAARIMRSQLLEVLNQDYIRTAKAKGVSKKNIIVHHALKNALIPVVTYIGMDFGGMLAGAILTETVFNWPGVGYEIYRAITQRDWPLVMGGVTIIVLVVLITSLIVDASYAFLDPRIRYGSKKRG